METSLNMEVGFVPSRVGLCSWSKLRLSADVSKGAYHQTRAQQSVYGRIGGQFRARTTKCVCAWLNECVVEEVFATNP